MEQVCGSELSAFTRKVSVILEGSSREDHTAFEGVSFVNWIFSKAFWCALLLLKNRSVESSSICWPLTLTLRKRSAISKLAFGALSQNFVRIRYKRKLSNAHFLSCLGLEVWNLIEESGNEVHQLATANFEAKISTRFCSSHMIENG